MRTRVAVVSLVALTLAVGAHLAAQTAPQFRVLMPGFPLWAYGYKEVPAAPQDWSPRPVFAHRRMPPSFSRSNLHRNRRRAA